MPEESARNLLSWSKRIGELFPPGQASADYVDMSSELVRSAPVAMNQSAEALLATVRTGNGPAIGDQLAQTVRVGCGACHLSNGR